MDDQLNNVGKVASSLSRNPNGIIALFIVLIYGMASLVTGFASGFSPAERLPLIYFLTIFPVLVFVAYIWLVSNHSGRLFAPGDFKNEDNFIKVQQLNAVTFQRESDLKVIPSEPVLRGSAVKEKADMALKGWIKSGDSPFDYEVGIDLSATYNGAASANIKSNGSPKGFGTLMQVFNAEKYRGKRLKMSGSAKSEGVRNWAGFWMRIDERNRNAVSFDNMQDRPIKGTTVWTTYQIVLDVPERSTQVAFGLLLDGVGQVWLSDIQFEVVSDDVPTTGQSNIPDGPINLDFQE